MKSEAAKALRAKEENLLTEWSDDDHEFIGDGIVDHDAWLEAPKRVLFLLKEAYRWKEEGALNLASAIRVDIEKDDRIKNHSMPVVGLWAFAIHEISRTGTIPAFPEESSRAESVKRALLSSAVVNVKKRNGKSQSGDDLAECARKDRDQIREQVELYAPDLIVCGSVWSIVKDSVFEDVQPSSSDRIIDWNGTKIIDFWHPNYRIPWQLSFYGLAGLAFRCK